MSQKTSKAAIGSAAIEAKKAAVEAAKARLKQKQAALADAERAARVREARKTRNDDTRRKLLIGVLMQAEADRDAQAKAYLEQLVETLTRADDRALFGLGPLPPEPTSPATQAPGNAAPEGVVPPISAP